MSAEKQWWAVVYRRVGDRARFLLRHGPFDDYAAACSMAVKLRTGEYRKGYVIEVEGDELQQRLGREEKKS